MRIAVVYNRESQSVINLFGTPNKEKIGLKTIKRITDALKAGGHTVTSFEGDKDLIARLEEFMPRVVKGEQIGMVFNVSYGLQGQARYTHVPSILEMVGVPYVASGPLAHSLALDKVVAKMIFDRRGLPTPAFAVLDGPESELPPTLEYPLIVKPKNEAVSFGIKIVHDPDEVREAAQVIFDKFDQPVLVERYIDGREVNVGVIGNRPPEALPPVELQFGEGGPKIYTYEDKTRRSGRTITPVCPAPLGDELTDRVQRLAVQAFQALGCADCARVDMRLDAEGNPWILEINSLPSLGEHGSFVEAAQVAGLEYPDLINRLVEVASARYFATPTVSRIAPTEEGPEEQVFRWLTERRDGIERRVRELSRRRVRTGDGVGIQGAAKALDRRLAELGMKADEERSDPREGWLWETPAGVTDGTLLVVQLDVPFSNESAPAPLHRDPQWLYGEGVAVTHGPLAMLEYALRSLRAQRQLRGKRVGVLAYVDEGEDCRHSAELLRATAERAERVFVLRPAAEGSKAVTERRGLRRLRLTVEGAPRRLGQAGKRLEVLRWTMGKLEAIAQLGSRRERIALSAIDIETAAYPMRLPHRVTTQLLMSYPEGGVPEVVKSIRELLGKEGYQWRLEEEADRPPMSDRARNRALAEELGRVAARWELPFGETSSLWPSAAGLVPKGTAALCGLGPVARDLNTPQEAVERVSLLGRTLLLSQYLLAHGR